MQQDGGDGGELNIIFIKVKRVGGLMGFCCEFSKEAGSERKIRKSIDMPRLAR